MWRAHLMALFWGEGVVSYQRTACGTVRVRAVRATIDGVRYVWDCGVLYLDEAEGLPGFRWISRRGRAATGER